MAVGRLSKLHGTDKAQFTTLVNDAFQGRGLGGELLRRLIQIGRDEKLRRITATMTADNRDMQRVCEELGFRLRRVDAMVRAEIERKKIDGHDSVNDICAKLVYNRSERLPKSARLRKSP